MSTGQRIITAITITLLASAALGQVGYWPLAEGNTWTYVSDGGQSETLLVTEQIPIFGHSAWVVDYPESSWNEPLENYWSEGPDGQVYLHGFWRDDQGGWGYLYEPPVLFVDAPLAVGDTWSTTYDTYQLPGEIFDEQRTITLTAVEFGTYVVPAGEFEAFGVGYARQAVLERAGRQYSLTGEALEPGGRDAGHWWSLGVGRIRYHVTDALQLESYMIGTVATEARSWSGIKNLFNE